MSVITSVSISANDVASIVNTTAKSPVDVANNIKSYHDSQKDTLDTAQMLVSALGTLETFASAIGQYKTSIPGLSLTLTSFGLNLLKAYDEIDKKGSIQNSTFNSICGDMSSLVMAVGVKAKNPYVVGFGLAGALGFSVASLLSTPDDTSMAGLVVDFFEEMNELFKTNQFNLIPSERQGLAYQISSGNNSGVLYAAYNQDRSLARYDPLVLDLNADGVKTISQQTSKAFFDLSGDGMSEQTGWIDSNDGFLVFDKNANGKIDNINELFGKSNLSGFSELKELFDANNDNLIDYKDTNYALLKVWQDINSDGISQANELKTLTELGITSINLKSTSTNINSNGNIIKSTSTFTQNGEIKQVVDIDFTSSKMLTDYAKDYTLTIDALSLPWLRGYGTVKDSHVLYSTDTSFAEFTKAFLKKDLKDIYNEFDTFLKKWTQLDTLHQQTNITRTTFNMDDKVWIMESITGQNLFKNSIENAYKNNIATSNNYNQTYINTNFQSFQQRIFNTFIMQSVFKEAFNGSYFDTNQDKVVIIDKKLLVSSLIENYKSSNDLNKTILLLSVIEEFKKDLNLNIVDFIPIKDMDPKKYDLLNTVLVAPTKTVNLFINNSLVFNGTNDIDIIVGTAENEGLFGENGNDILSGEKGNDSLFGDVEMIY